MLPTETARLGRSALSITRFGLGTAGLGTLPVAGDATARAIVEHAVASGIGYIDTAPVYDRGAAERRLGEALATADRDRIVLSTKVGTVLRPLPFTHRVTRVLRRGLTSGPEGWRHIGGQVRAVVRGTHAGSGRSSHAGGGDRPEIEMSEVADLSYDGVMRSLEESLARLGTDRVDLLLLHEPRRRMSTVMDGAYRAMDRLRTDGTVRAIGIADDDVATMCDYIEAADFDCALLGFRYTLLDQTAARTLLPLASRRGVGVIVGGVFNGGILADPRPGVVHDQRPATTEAIRQAVRLQEHCERHGVPLKAAAIQFPLRHPAVVSVLVGVRSVAELDEDLDLFQHSIPDALWATLLDEGLLDAGR